MPWGCQTLYSQQPERVQGADTREQAARTEGRVKETESMGSTELSGAEWAQHVLQGIFGELCTKEERHARGRQGHLHKPCKKF